MSIEAMKQAYEVPLVEQLESVPNNARLVIDDADGMGTRYIPVGRMCHDASKALRQAIAEAEKQEPVEWGVDWGKDGNSVSIIKRLADGNIEVLAWEYAPHPQPKQEQGEPVAYLCENAVGHKYFRWKKPSSTYKPIALYTTPQQRTWVGLTDEEIKEGESKEELGHGFIQGALWAEAKLKEKNT